MRGVLGRGGIVCGGGVALVHRVVVSRRVAGARARVLVGRGIAGVHRVVSRAVGVGRLAMLGLARLERRSAEGTEAVAARYARLAHDLGAAAQDPRVRALRLVET